MRVLIDTNVLLDVLCGREGFAQAAAVVFKLCETGRIEGFVSAVSVPNIMYILRKELNAEKTADILKMLNLIFRIADLKAGDLTEAAALKFPDYEDALQYVCAKRIGAEYIVTRNEKDFRSGSLPALSPGKLIKILRAK